MKMWKDVVAVKRVFKEMSASTKIELGKIRCEITGTTREVSGACSAVSANMRNVSKMDVSWIKRIEFYANDDCKFKFRKLRINITNVNWPT